MAAPPNDVEPSELFLKLLERPKPSATFPFPRTVKDAHGKEEPIGTIRVFVLNEKDLHECKMAVRRWGDEKLKGGTGVIAEMDKDMLGDRLGKEILARSIHMDQMIGGTEDSAKGPQYKRLFAGADDLDVLTADEFALLYGSYLATQRQFGPTDASFEDEREVMEWVVRLQEGGGSFLLSLLQSHQRDDLLLRLIEIISDTFTTLSDSQPEKWQRCLESRLSTWRAGIDSFTTPAAESTDSREETRVITKEEALAAAMRVRAISQAEG